jgi:hypothetical protein
MLSHSEAIWRSRKEALALFSWTNVVIETVRKLHPPMIGTGVYEDAPPGKTADEALRKLAAEL